MMAAEGFGQFVVLAEPPGQGVPGIDVLPPLEVIRIDLVQVPGDFSDNGSDWKNLAIVTIGGSELAVELSNDAAGYVIADAVRIQPLT